MHFFTSSQQPWLKQFLIYTSFLNGKTFQSKVEAGETEFLPPKTILVVERGTFVEKWIQVMGKKLNTNFCTSISKQWTIFKLNVKTVLMCLVPKKINEKSNLVLNIRRFELKVLS